MKGTSYFAMLLTLTCFIACSKGGMLKEPAPGADGLVVSASIQEGDTKVSISMQGNCLKARWGKWDKIIVFDADGHTYGYKVVKVEESVATLQFIPQGEEGCGNTESEPLDGTVLYAAYCPGHNPEEIESGVMSLDLSSQNGTAGRYAVLLSQATVTSGSVFFHFKNEMSILGVLNPVLAGLTEGEMTGLSIAGPEIYNRAEIRLVDSEVKLLPVSKGSITVTVGESLAIHDGCTPDSTLILAAVLPFREESDLYLTAILEDKSTLFRHCKSDKLFEASKFYRTSPKFERKDALGGQFSVSATKKVFFSGGNLWCDATVSPAVWSFESDQHFIPYYNIHEGIKNVYDPTHVRHFFWSDDATYGASEHYEGTSFPTAGQQVDWGEAYCESSGNPGWSTLSEQEWNWLLSVRGSDSTFFRNDVSIADNSDKYLVIAPDGNTEVIRSSYNILEWREAEKKGFVCLAPSGYRSEANYPDVPCMLMVGTNGFYWTSDACGNLGDRARALSVTFGKSPYSFNLHGRYVRQQGFSVRLVCE